MHNFFFLFCCTGLEPRAPCIPGKRSAPALPPSSPFTHQQAFRSLHDEHTLSHHSPHQSRSSESPFVVLKKKKSHGINEQISLLALQGDSFSISEKSPSSQASLPAWLLQLGGFWDLSGHSGFLRGSDEGVDVRVSVGSTSCLSLQFRLCPQCLLLVPFLSSSVQPRGWCVVASSFLVASE